MKIQILSDLHREFDRTASRGPAPRRAAIPDSDTDVIVLAGDVDTGLTGLRWAIGEAERLARPILYVFGNHEYYGQTIPRLLAASYLLLPPVVCGSKRQFGRLHWTRWRRPPVAEMRH